MLFGAAFHHAAPSLALCDTSNLISNWGAGLVGLYMLAAIGVLAVAQWLLQPLWAYWRLRRLANEFHAASIEVFAAIGEASAANAPNDLFVLLALRRWVSVHTSVRKLSESERRRVVKALRRHRIVVSEVEHAVTAFIDECGRPIGLLSAHVRAPVRSSRDQRRMSAVG